ncbi:ANTAR domain-containing protein [Sanguibacter sp. 25GB23B1]|uniref:PAS and ANTAR domain-containing protein n=1 Tax=unclassified Sanguibacter TaxID=2645534 RepID=UPI0032AF77D9
MTDVARSAEVVGRFVVDLDTEHWRWSDEMYHLHGFEPHEVIPTTELMLTHREAAEGPNHAPTLRTLADAAESGEVFGSTYRIVDATGRHRTVALVGSVHPAGPDDPRQIEGFMLDLTVGEQVRLEADLRDAVTSFRERAATIEQAKGILMEIYALPAEEAFEVLRAHSNEANVKVHSLAEHLVRHGPSRTEADTAPRVGDPVLAHRLGLSAAGPEELTIETTWPSPRHAEITLVGRVEESDVARIDECVSELLHLRPSVLAVRLDLRRSTGPAAALPALRRALVRFHHASIIVEVVGDDIASGHAGPEPDPEPDPDPSLA